MVRIRMPFSYRERTEVENKIYGYKINQRDGGLFIDAKNTNLKIQLLEYFVYL